MDVLVTSNWDQGSHEFMSLIHFWKYIKTVILLKRFFLAVAQPVSTVWKVLWCNPSDYTVRSKEQDTICTCRLFLYEITRQLGGNLLIKTAC